jgi:hypothetical protein
MSFLTGCIHVVKLMKVVYVYGQAAFRDKAMQYHPSKSINKSPKNQGISVQPACITSCFCM